MLTNKMFHHIIMLVFFLRMTQASDRTVCYYISTAHQGKSAEKKNMSPRQIDPYLCSHVIYGFAHVSGFEMTTSRPEDDKIIPRVKKMVSLNPSTRLLVAIASVKKHKESFNKITSSDLSVAYFSAKVIHFLRKWRFDGLDWDWLDPEQTLSDRRKERLVTLVMKLRESFNQESKRTGRPKLLLTASIGGDESIVKNGYKISELHPYFDFISLRAYEYQSVVKEPLRSNELPWYQMADWKQHWMVRDLSLEPPKDGCPRYKESVYQTHLQKFLSVVPSEKLNLGLATFGRLYSTQEDVLDSVRKRLDSESGLKLLIRTERIVGFYQICGMMSDGAELSVTGGQQFRLLRHKGQWVGYEDENSIKQKVCYARSMKLGGIMVWSLDLDDYSGNFCSKGHYPLLKAAYEELNTPREEFAWEIKNKAPEHQPPSLPAIVVMTWTLITFL